MGGCKDMGRNLYRWGVVRIWEGIFIGGGCKDMGRNLYSYKAWVSIAKLRTFEFRSGG